MSISDGIGKLPDGWEVKPLRSVADYIVSNVDKVASESEIPIRLCNYTDVYHNEYITLGLDFMRATASEDEISKFNLLVNDVVITKDSEAWDDIGAPALVRETADDLVCGYHLALLRPRKQAMDGSFLFRCFQAKPVRFQLELSARGITRFGLSKSEIGAMRLPVPPLPQQHAIADYLDRKTAQLDALVTVKKRVLKLLAEKRQALIARVVTQGIDPNVHYRDSGIPWLGAIPAHWEVERARWLFNERDERSLNGDEELLTVSHLTGVTSRSEKQVSMFEADSKAGYKICLEGDLVINTLWAWMGAMGVTPLEGIVSPSYHVYELKEERIHPAYVEALTRISQFSQEVMRYSKGVWSSRLRLYPEGFFEMLLPVPPMEEQHAISDYLNWETTQLDALTLGVKKTIALLRERRSAVIAAVVTGQMEVECVA